MDVNINHLNPREFMFKTLSNKITLDFSRQIYICCVAVVSEQDVERNDDNKADVKGCRVWG